MIIVIVGVYAFSIEPHLLVIKKYNIGESDENLLTVVQLSDLELSQNYKAKELLTIVEKINSLNPDLVVFTGDLFQNYSQYRPVEDVVSALGNITATYGKYAIWGNNDYGGGAVREYGQIMERSDFKLLQNEGLSIKLSNGETIFLGGLDDSLLGNPDIDLTLKNLDENSSYDILLIHEPEQVDLINHNNLDLILAGHSHGGQINIKFLRKVFGIESKYRMGFYNLDTFPDTDFYVNSGLGTSRVPARFLIPPQITCFKIGLTDNE